MLLPVVLGAILALAAPAGASVRPQAAPGVDAKTIKVALLDGDLKQLIDLGFAVDIGDVLGQTKALVADINAHGGVHGRKIVLTQHQSDILDATSGQAACIAATEDDKVFAVLEPNAVNASVAPCVTQQHRTPMIAQGASAESIEKADGLLFSTASVDPLEAKQLVKLLDQGGYLKGKKIGIVGGSDPSSRDAIDDGFKPALKAAGLEATDEQILSCTGAVCSGYPTAVQSFKRSGVNLVLSTLGALSYPAFVAEANQQDLHPQYTASPIGGVTTDVVAKQQDKNGTAFDGALGTVHASQAALMDDTSPPPAFNEECAKTYAAHGGPRLTKAKTPDKYGGLGVVCSIVRILERGLEGAGKNPTPQSFSKAVRKLARVPLNGGGVGSYGPNKFAAVDDWALVQWHKDCVCWLPVGNDAATAPTRP